MAALPSIGRATRVDRPSASEAEATQALYERFAGQIFGYCLHQLGSREEAEDAVQTTFMNAFRGLRRGIVPEVESAWLFKIAHNVCLSRRRSSWRRGRVEAPNDLQVLQEVVPARERIQDDLIGLQDALDQMPETQRRAILLREWQGLSYREIAEELELSQAAVETLIFRARRTLANGLEQPARAGTAVRRARRGADAGAVLLWLKALFGGGGTAAVKVAAAVVAVATTTAVAESPFHHGGRGAHKVPPAASAASSAATTKQTVAAIPAHRLAAATTAVGTDNRRQLTSVRSRHGRRPARPDTPGSVPVAAPPQAVAPSHETPSVTPPTPAAPAPAASSEPPRAKGEKDGGDHHGSSGSTDGSEQGTPAAAATSEDGGREQDAASVDRSAKSGDGDHADTSASSSTRERDGDESAKTPVAVTTPTDPTPPVLPPTHDHGDGSRDPGERD